MNLYTRYKPYARQDLPPFDFSLEQGGSALRFSETDPQSFKVLTVTGKRIMVLWHHHQQEPNSAIHFSYFSRSAADTDVDTFLSAVSKSSIVVGMCISSFDKFRISSGVKPSIRLRIAIRDASLQLFKNNESLIELWHFKH